MGKDYNKIFEDVFQDSAHNKKYSLGIRKFENLFKKYPEAEEDDVVLSRLGLMHDHLAQKYPKKRIKYENRALGLYNKALKFHPDSHNATWGIGRVWWHRKSKKALPYALKALRLAKKANAPIGIYTSNVGLVYKFIGDNKMAEKWFLKAIKVEPDNWGPYLNLITSYRQNGNIEKTKKYLLKFEKLVKKEDSWFLNTVWGKQVLGVVKDLKRHFKIAK